MNKHTEHNTREHLLATGEQLCLQRGFTGMGLSELSLYWNFCGIHDHNIPVYAFTCR